MTVKIRDSAQCQTLYQIDIDAPLLILAVKHKILFVDLTIEHYVHKAKRNPGPCPHQPTNHQNSH